MARRSPITALDTREVENQPAPFVDQDLFLQYCPLREAMAAAGASSLEQPLTWFGDRCGSHEARTWRNGRGCPLPTKKVN